MLHGQVTRGACTIDSASVSMAQLCHIHPSQRHAWPQLTNVCRAVLSRPCLLPLLFVVSCVPAAADMVQRGCERNVITYSSLISACEKAGRCEMALQLFERMHKEGCIPNVVTYNSLIAACSHGETSTSCACQART